MARAWSASKAPALAEHVDPPGVRRARVEHRAGDQVDVAGRVGGELGRHHVRAEVGDLGRDLRGQRDAAGLVGDGQPVARLALEGRDPLREHLGGEPAQVGAELGVAGRPGRRDGAADAARAVRDGRPSWRRTPRPARRRRPGARASRRNPAALRGRPRRPARRRRAPAAPARSRRSCRPRSPAPRRSAPRIRRQPPIAARAGPPPGQPPAPLPAAPSSSGALVTSSPMLVISVLTCASCHADRAAQRGQPPARIIQMRRGGSRSARCQRMDP